MSNHLCGYAEVQSYTGAVTLVAPPHMSEAHPRGICVDVCLALEITKLWQQGITTTGCCCGHGSHPAYIGVIDADIPKMKAMGYAVAPNPMRPGDEDSFVPKTELQSLRSPQPAGVRVKGLEWDDDGEVSKARTSIGTYVVGKVQGKFGWVNSGLSGWNYAGSFEEAKAAAEADYRQRILSAIEPQQEEAVAPVISEIVAERQRQIAKGYDATHDDQHVDREIIDSMEWGAAVRLHQAKWTKDPALYEQELIKAAAMIVSEIERSRREVRS